MILVFGKSGQVARELYKFGDTVLLNRTQADLTDPTACRNIIADYKPTSVVNAAAYTAVDRADEEEDLATLINGEAPGEMAQACVELNIPLIHLSTDYVFDGSGTIAWKASDRTNPINAYGRSKLKGEEAIKGSRSTHAILRTSWVVSAHGNNFVKTMLQLSETRDRLNVVDDQIGGPTCARDIAEACISIARQLRQDPKKSGTYHFSGTPNVSWCQLANAIFERAGRNTIAEPIPTSKYPTPVMRPMNSRLNCGLTNRKFNMSRPFWRDGLVEILRDLEIKHDTA